MVIGVYKEAKCLQIKKPNGDRFYSISKLNQSIKSKVYMISFSLYILSEIHKKTLKLFLLQIQELKEQFHQ